MSALTSALTSVLVVGALVTPASIALAAPRAPAKPASKPAPPPPPVVPKLGEELPWPTLKDWVYATPSANDAAGKVVVHWFCATKIAACKDDLARIITLREAGKVYVIGYINGGARDAKKLDPIRESEGVGAGSLAFGPGVAKLDKAIGVTGAASVVVGVDGKVALITSGADPEAMDGRDKKVAELVAAITPYKLASSGPTATVKPDEKFDLTLSIALASWLKYSAKTPAGFALTVTKDIKCDATKLKAEQLKIDGQGLTAKVTCSGPKGSYEARGEIEFGYESPGGETGLGADSVNYKFEIK
jgi:hypothetical protein